MHDDDLRGLLRTLETDREPDPAFADAAYERIEAARRRRVSRRTPSVLLAAAALLSVVAAAAALGAGPLRLPLVVDTTNSPLPSSSAMAVESMTPAASASAPSSSAEPSVTAEPSPDPAAAELVGRILWAEADGLRVRGSASESAEVLATLRRGQLMGATGATETDAGGVTWYEVAIGPGDLTGWVAGGPGGDWLRRVDDGIVTFGCQGCGSDQTALVGASPFGDGALRTLSTEELTEWEWSPDGTRIVASQGGTTLPYRIVILSPDGAIVEDLGVGATPSWSPDGTRLAWIGDGGLVVTDTQLNPDAVDLRGLPPGAAEWSPDGTRFAFIAAEDPTIIDPPVSIYVVGADGGAPSAIVGPGIFNRVTWAPDGSMLGFTTVDLGGASPSRAFVVPADGGEPRALLDGAEVLIGPVWSPDGRSLALVTAEGIVLTDGDGGSPRVLVTAEPGQTIGELSWSPSGGWLLYSISAGREPTLWIVAADGTQAPVPISPEGAAAVRADWQPVLSPLN